MSSSIPISIITKEIKRKKKRFQRFYRVKRHFLELFKRKRDPGVKRLSQLSSVSKHGTLRDWEYSRFAHRKYVQAGCGDEADVSLERYVSVVKRGPRVKFVFVEARVVTCGSCTILPSCVWPRDVFTLSLTHATG